MEICSLGWGWIYEELCSASEEIINVSFDSFCVSIEYVVVVDVSELLILCSGDLLRCPESHF